MNDIITILVAITAIANLATALIEMKKATSKKNNGGK